MKRFWSYLKYVVRHKWFVLVAGNRIGASYWRLLIHDASKFLPSEWLPYSRTFYKPDGSNQYVESPEFNMAWLMHQHRNKHHWQYWILKMDCGLVEPLPMPTKYIYEMVADWMGAGRAITGKWEVREWYEKNKNEILLSKRTKLMVEFILKEV